MATQAIAGRSTLCQLSNGSASTSATALGDGRQVVDYELTVERPTIDATSFDSSGWNESIAGVAGWSGSVESIARVDDISVTTLDNFLGTLRGSLSPFYSLLLQLSTTGTGPRWTGTVRLTQVELSQSYDEVLRQRVAFRGVGAFTYTS